MTARQQGATSFTTISKGYMHVQHHTRQKHPGYSYGRKTTRFPFSPILTCKKLQARALSRKRIHLVKQRRPGLRQGVRANVMSLFEKARGIGAARTASHAHSACKEVHMNRYEAVARRDCKCLFQRGSWYTHHQSENRSTSYQAGGK